MSITNKRSFVHQANKNRSSSSDFDKKARVVGILRDSFGIHAIGIADEFYYFRDKNTNQVKIDTTNPKDVLTKEEMFRKYQVQRMDLYVKQRYPDIIIEIDGLEHGFFDEITESQQTTDRNLNYKLGGYTEEKKNYLKLTTEDLKEEDETLVTIIEYKLGLKAISKDSLGHHGKTG